ncbi:MAG: helix-turn-helix domain-containing protein [Peptococcaceae bacterium]
MFKDKRREKDLSILDVEQGTKIRGKYIEAIEEENFDVLPGKVYVKGFIKSYAKYLNIENNEEIKRFLESDQVKEFHKEELISPPPIEVNKGLSKKYVTIILAVFAIALLFGVQSIYLKYIQKQPPKNPEQTPNSIDIPNEQPDLPEEVPDTPPESDVASEPENITLSLKIIDVGQQEEACWIQIYTDSVLNFEGTLYEGEIKNIEAQDKVKITLGNAGVVELKLGTQELGIPGKIGEVITKEFTRDDLQ